MKSLLRPPEAFGIYLSEAPRELRYFFYAGERLMAPLLDHFDISGARLTSQFSVPAIYANELFEASRQPDNIEKPVSSPQPARFKRKGRRPTPPPVELDLFRVGRVGLKIEGATATYSAIYHKEFLPRGACKGLAHFLSAQLYENLRSRGITHIVFPKELVEFIGARRHFRATNLGLGQPIPLEKWRDEMMRVAHEKTMGRVGE